MKNALSVIIIARNEEEALPDCLTSIQSLADEIILVDSGSTDQTLDIAKRFGAKTFHRDWQGFSAQKQFAMDQAAGPWILNLDADERVSPQLAEEIKKNLDVSASPLVQGFDLPFYHHFGKTRLRFGASWGESHVRLVRKDKARYGKESIHEGLQVDGAIGRLKGPILHFSTKNIHDYLTKCNYYTSTIAREKFRRGARFQVWHHLRLPWEFLVRYVFKLGFLDGGAGLVYALLSSYYVWLKFAKLKDFEEVSV